MKIYIPTIKENEENNSKENANNEYLTSSSGLVNDKLSNSSNVKKNKNEKININTANIEQLETLPGIGPTTATKIINYREENGKFKTIEDIKQVSGIGENKFEKIKNNITVK